jgi:hypothetical protein
MKNLMIFVSCSLLIIFLIAGCTEIPKDMNVCGDGTCTLTVNTTNLQYTFITSDQIIAIGKFN